MFVGIILYGLYYYNGNTLCTMHIHYYILLSFTILIARAFVYLCGTTGRDLSKVLIQLFEDDDEEAILKRLKHRIPIVKLDSLDDEIYNPMRNIHLA